MNNVRQSDPTKTITLRNAFASDMRARINRLARDVVYAIVKDDCLGLNIETPSVFASTPQSPGYKRFAYLRKDAKIESFMLWMNEMQDKRVLQIISFPQLGQSMNARWTDTYLESAYAQGIKRASDEMRHIGMAVPFTSKEQALAIMKQPIHAERAGLIYTRAFSDLKGITKSMDTQISRILAQAILEGKSPKEVAGAIADVLIGNKTYSAKEYIGAFMTARRRAELIAQTEIVRAHHLAMVQEYRNWGVINVKVNAEWVTAQDDRVCEICESMEGQVFTLDEVEGLIPVHPGCRCCIIPSVEEVSSK